MSTGPKTPQTLTFEIRHEHRADLDNWIVDQDHGYYIREALDLGRRVEIVLFCPDPQAMMAAKFRWC